MKLDCIFIGLVALLLSHLASAQDPVSFPDANLKAIVEDALWISDPTPADMLGLINLIGSNRNVANLTGLETATSLEDLTMSYNRISDISMLSGLSNLTILALSNNQISEINWDKVCNGPLYTSYYKVYRAPSADGVKTAITPWQSDKHYYDMTVEPRRSYTYWVEMSLDQQGSDASELGGPEEGRVSSQPALRLSSGAGGFVTVPGAGVHVFPIGAPPVQIQAEPSDGILFRFAGWTGTAVEAGLVSDRTQPHTTVVVNDNYRLRAHFESTQRILYVDDDALGDPGPGDSSLSDPEENGTTGHPFDRIQEAIEVAAAGASIVVGPGTYDENLDSLGKGFQLIGLDPNGADFPVIHGNGTGPVVYFRDSRDPICLMTGFVITQGPAGPASAVHCRNSHPTFSHCLVVGNRSTDQAGDAILCSDSNAVFTHCTIAHNLGSIRLVNSRMTVTNSIVWENSPSEMLWDETSELAIDYSAIAGAWPGQGNLDSDPLFVAPGAWQMPVGASTRQWVTGDYHPMSRTGRWDPEKGLWLQDALHSPWIDAGDPAARLASKPRPMGAGPTWAPTVAQPRRAGAVKRRAKTPAGPGPQIQPYCITTW